MPTVTATLIITSAEFSAPLSYQLDSSSFAVPFTGEFKAVASSPAGKLVETVAISLSVDGISIIAGKPVGSFPINLPAALGFLAGVIEAIDATITLDVVSA